MDKITYIGLISSQMASLLDYNVADPTENKLLKKNFVVKIVFGFLWQKSTSGWLCKCALIMRINHKELDCLVWPQWWSFADVSQQGVDFSKKNL